MTRTTRLTLAFVLGMATLATVTAAIAAQTSPANEDKTLFMNEQQSFIPGYPIGNIAIGDPKVADFRVLPGRRELLLVSKGLGQTTLTVWDQNNVKRHEVLLTVTTRQALQTESELKELLKDFPGVRVATLAGSLVVTGMVKSANDMNAIDKIASAAKAKNLVRLDLPPTPTPGASGTSASASAAAPNIPAPSSRPSGATSERATTTAAAGASGTGAAAAPPGSNIPAPSATSPSGRPLGAAREGASAAPAAGASGTGAVAVPTPVSAPTPASVPTPSAASPSVPVTVPSATQPRVPVPSPTPPAISRPPAGAVPENAPATSPARPPIQVDYEIELFEASTKFRSGSYARGIEPSGRSLFKGTLRTTYGIEAEIFIGGSAVAPARDNKQFEKKQTAKGADGGSAKPVETGIRLKLRPDNITQNGQFTTFILVETNLPIGTDTYEPDTWRRARWEFKAVSGEPFGITGGDLLATPDMPGSGTSLGSTATRTASRATSVPGVSSVPGMNYVPVFGSLFSSKSYQTKATQLLVILRPKFAVPGK